MISPGKARLLKSVKKFLAVKSGKGVKKRVLIDSLDNPEFFLSNIYVVRALAERKNIEVFFQAGSQRINEMYESLGFKKIRELHWSIRSYIRFMTNLHYYYDLILFKKKTVEDWRIGDILIGDLVIDSIQKFDERLKYASEYNTSNCNGWLKIAYNHWHTQKYLLKKYQFTYATITHKYYVNYGIQLRLGVSLGIQFFYLLDSIFQLSTVEDCLLSEYHLAASEVAYLKSLNEARVQAFIDKRFSGRHVKWGSDLPFADKKIYSKEEFVRTMSLNPSLPIAIIYLHAFGDANHYEQGMLYDSYYHWFTNTIEIIKTIDHVNWLVKEHPYSYLYNEIGVVKKICDEHGLTMIHPDVSAVSVFANADAIITVRGTVGLEAVLFNTVPILAGNSYYNKYGFTISPRNVRAYADCLREIAFKKENQFNDEQRDWAARLLLWVTDLLALDSELMPLSNLALINDEDFEKQLAQIEDRIQQIGGIENDTRNRAIRKYLLMEKRITKLLVESNLS